MSSNVIVFKRSEIAQPAFEPMSKSHRLLEFWQSRCVNGAVPEVASLSLSDVPELLPDLWMLDYDAADPGFRFIMAGSRITEGIGKSVNDVPLQEIYPFLKPGHSDFDDLLLVIHTAKPRASFGAGSSLEDPHAVTQESLYLPIARDGLPRGILAVTDCRDHLGQDCIGAPFVA